MRNETAADTKVASNVGGNGGTPPLAFVVAVWLGMPREEILRGLGEGWIAVPPGAPPGWTPAGWSAADKVEGGAPSGGAAATSGSLATNASPESDPGPMRDDRAPVHGWRRAPESSLADSAFAPLWQRAGTDDGQRSDAWTDDRAKFAAWRQHAASTAGGNVKAMRDREEHREQGAQGQDRPTHTRRHLR